MYASVNFTKFNGGGAGLKRNNDDANFNQIVFEYCGTARFCILTIPSFKVLYIFRLSVWVFVCLNRLGPNFVWDFS